MLSPTLYASQRTSNSEMAILSHEVSLRVLNFQCRLHFYNCIHHTQKIEENKKKKTNIIELKLKSNKLLFVSWHMYRFTYLQSLFMTSITFLGPQSKRHMVPKLSSVNISTRIYYRLEYAHWGTIIFISFWVWITLFNIH